MTDGRGTVREIVWQDIFPGIILLRTFRLGISLRVLVLAAVGLVVTTIGWSLIGSVFSGTDDHAVTAAIRARNVWPWLPQDDVALLASPSDIAQGAAHEVPFVGRWLSGGPILAVWQNLTGPFRGLFDKRLSIVGAAYLLMCSLWATLVWAVCGGAITRIAVLAIAREESATLGLAVRHVLSRLGSYFLAPLFPLAGIVLALIPLAVLGLLMRVELGMLIGGLLWPVVLIAGLFMAILAIGLAAGWPLMWPTISSEGTDAFDALSRSYAYVYQRPLAYLLYAVIASVIGLLGVIVVELFATAVIELGWLGISWGAGRDLMSAFDVWLQGGKGQNVPALSSAGVSLIAMWNGGVRAIATGFQFGYFFVAATAIYLLLRRHVDATEMDEVFVEEQAEQYGLPPLKTDAAGVPVVEDTAE